MPEIVIAGRTQGLPRHRIIGDVDCVTAQGFSVSAVSRRPVGLGVAGCAGGVVHGPVAWCSQGGEHLRMSGDFSVYVVVAAGGSGVHQLPGVAGIQI